MNQATGKLDPFIVLFQFATVVLTVALFLGFYWLAIDDNPPAEVFSAEPVTVEVYPGDVFVYSFDACRYTTASVTVYKAWVNGLVFQMLPVEPVTFPPNCNPDGRPGFVVPKDLPPGEYTLLVDLVYHINPLIDRTVSFEVGPITVMEPLSD